MRSLLYEENKYSIWIYIHTIHAYTYISTVEIKLIHAYTYNTYIHTYIKTYIHCIYIYTHMANNTRKPHPYMDMHTKLLYSVTNVKNVSTEEVFPDEQPARSL